MEDRKIEISEFNVDMMEKNTALVCYKAQFKENGKVSWRTSIWKKNKCDWTMYYHQGTDCKRLKTGMSGEAKGGKYI